MILSIDIGTSNLKAALINESGGIAGIAHAQTPEASIDGYPCYNPGQLVSSLEGLVESFSVDLLARVSLIVFTGMAEAGLIADRFTLEPLSPIRPWFDRAALPLYERTRSDSRFSNRQSITGLPDSGKYGIYKLLTLLESGSYDTSHVMWIGVVAFIASRLTGQPREDISIASRTACVDIVNRRWDEGFIESLGLSKDNFPQLISQGGVAGELLNDWHGIHRGIPVCLGGHDHVCAALGCGALGDGRLFISTGTAQVLLSTSKSIETCSGLSYGPAPEKGNYTVLGSIQSAGGSVNMFRKLLYQNSGFDEMINEAGQACYPPGLLYYPYLAGSGAPHINPSARASLLGLSDDTKRSDIILGVYAGISLETRFLWDSAGAPDINLISCMGGLTRHSRYMQTLSDVLNVSIAVPCISEGTLYGAAAIAMRENSMSILPCPKPDRIYEPDKSCTAHWNKVYHDEYLTIMKALYGGNTNGI